MVCPRYLVVGAIRSLFVIYMGAMVTVVVFNATFNNILAISWRSVLLVEETGVPGENHRPVASHLQTLSQNIVLSIERDSNTQL